MRSKFSSFPFFSLAIATFAAACSNVPCEDRGTCPPGETTEGTPDAAASSEKPTLSDSTVTGSFTVDGSVITSGEGTSSAGCITSCASQDSAVSSSYVPGFDGGSSATSSTGAGSDFSWAATLTSDAYSASSETCVEICDCDSGACPSSSEVVEAGPPSCSEADIAACVAPASICVWENDAPLCIECRTSDDCEAPTGVCVANHCEVCAFDTNVGCGDQTPYCVAVGETTADGGTTQTVAQLTDAAPPSESLDAGTPAATRECVECRSGNDCGPEAPLCVAGSCVQCLADTDCTNPDEPRCDTATNTCAGCDAIGQCSRFDGTSACNLTDGKCVECTAAESAVCGDFVCQTTPGAGQYRCSEQEPQDIGRCEPCVSDAACGTGLACILENFNDQDTEWVCLPRRPENGCTSFRQLIASLPDATSADGETGTFCKPPRTSCAAVRHFANGGLKDPEWCDSDDDCGLPGQADGYCLPYLGEESTRACTYECLGSAECRNAVPCETVDGSGETAVCSLD